MAQLNRFGTMRPASMSRISGSLVTLSLLAATVCFSSASWSRDERELISLVRQDCGSCHGMSLNGGLGSPLTPASLRDKPIDSLVATILHGRPGTAMPAWKSILSESEVSWIAHKLVEGFPKEKQ